MMKKNEDKSEPLPPAENDVNCKCGVLIGRKVQCDDGVWLVIAGSLQAVASAYGRCPCGLIWHWKQTDITFAKLMKHYEGQPS